ncbi:MAG TPA: SCO family protein [Rhizomicrobium sp.]
MIRTPEAFIPYVLAFATLLAGLLWHFGDAAGQLGYTVTYGQADIGGPYTLIDQNGAVRSNKDFHGTWTLIYFGYTHCPDVCPVTLSVMADVMDRLGTKRARVTPIFITVDPARDTPALMKSYVASFGKDFVGLTGSTKSIAAVTKEFRVYAKRQDLPGGDYAMSHSSVIYLMDPNGKFAMDYDEVAGPEKIAADIAKRL